MDPGPSFTSEIQSTAIIYFLHFLQVTFIIHTIRLTLCFQQAGEIDNLTVTLGQSFLVVLCRCCLKSYWFDNLGFFSEGKLAATLIIPSSLCLPTDVWSARIRATLIRASELKSLQNLLNMTGKQLGATYTCGNTCKIDAHTWIVMRKHRWRSKFCTPKMILNTCWRWHSDTYN